MTVALLEQPDPDPVGTRRRMRKRLAKSGELENYATHVSGCGRIMDRAFELVCDVRDLDPRELWRALDELDPWQLKAMTMALAAMVDDCSPLLTWLTTLGDERGSGSSHTAAARGLAALVPRRRRLEKG